MAVTLFLDKVNVRYVSSIPAMTGYAVTVSGKIGTGDSAESDTAALGTLVKTTGSNKYTYDSGDFGLTLGGTVTTDGGYSNVGMEFPSGKYVLVVKSYLTT